VSWGDDDGGGGAWDGVIEIEAGGDASGEGEMTLAQLFEDEATRGALIDDLLELQAFLTQRRAEAASGATEGLPSELQLDSAELALQLAAVDEIVGALDNEHTRHLLLLQSSPKYMDRQEQALRCQLDHADKMIAMAAEIKSREAELLLTIQGAYPKYQAVVDAVKATKGRLEGAISKRFDGRRINLMGEINSL